MTSYSVKCKTSQSEAEFRDELIELASRGGRILIGNDIDEGSVDVGNREVKYELVIARPALLQDLHTPTGHLIASCSDGPIICDLGDFVALAVHEVDKVVSEVVASHRSRTEVDLEDALSRILRLFYTPVDAVAVGSLRARASARDIRWSQIHLDGLAVCVGQFE